MTSSFKGALRAGAGVCVAVLLSVPSQAHDRLHGIMFESTQAAPAGNVTAPMPTLVEAPADAQTWIITSVAGPHGWSKRWTEADGTRRSRESLLLRGLSTELEQSLRVDARGLPLSGDIKGRTPSGDAGESFRIDNGRLTYRSPVDSGDGPIAPGALYVPLGGTTDYLVAMVESLLKAPDRSLALAPSGRATLRPLTTLTVSNGRESKTLQGWAVVGIGTSPFPVWTEGDRFFAVASFLNYVPQGWEGVAPELSRAQDAALASLAPTAAQLARRIETPLAFTGVRLFDSEAKTFRENMTVVVRDGRIAAVGPAATTRPPAGAEVIDGRGKTLTPGLWDNHMHYGDDFTGPLLLSMGVTSVRDPGNRPDESIARVRRIQSGALLGPRVIPMMLIDGPGPYAAQMAVTATDEASALAAVERAERDGFAGVKLYGSLKPELVPVIARRAHELGLRVQGHIPAGMRPLDAVRAGYDEITHINFVMMQAAPPEVLAASNTTQRFYGPARFAADVDLNSPEMRAYLDELGRRRIAVDPTLAIFENGFCENPGQVAAMYAPWMDALPPAVRRGTLSGGFAPLPDLPRERMCQSFGKLQALIPELNRRGVTLLAGTDGSGLELIRDLELYVRAGLTPAEALATATINPARAFGLERETGSITVGKAAELALIDGDPSRNISDIRQVELVMRDGLLMRAADLRAAAGLGAGPKRGD